MSRLQISPPSKQAMSPTSTPTQEQDSGKRDSTFPTNIIVWSLKQAHFLGHYTYYRALLTAGLDINRTLDSRGTALTYAAFQNDSTLISYLLGRGASPSNAAVEIAVSMGSIDSVQQLCQAGAELNGERSEVLQRAAQRGDAEMVTLLLDYGAQVDHIPSESDLDWLKPRSTALHEACDAGSRAVMLVLIERGADIEAKDWAGKTVLDRAKEMGSKANDIIDTLRSHLVSKVLKRCDW